MDGLYQGLEKLVEGKLINFDNVDNKVFTQDVTEIMLYIAKELVSNDPIEHKLLLETLLLTLNVLEYQEIDDFISLLEYSNSHFNAIRYDITEWYMDNSFLIEKLRDKLRNEYKFVKSYVVLQWIDDTTIIVAELKE